MIKPAILQKISKVFVLADGEFYFPLSRCQRLLSVSYPDLHEMLETVKGLYFQTLAYEFPDEEEWDDNIFGLFDLDDRQELCINFNFFIFFIETVAHACTRKSTRIKANELRYFMRSNGTHKDWLDAIVAALLDGESGAAFFQNTESLDSLLKVKEKIALLGQDAE